MALKKQNFAEGEIAIFDEACVYKRGEYWQFRLWLPKEVKRLCKEFGFTPWIGFKKRDGSTGKAMSLLEKLNPNMKTDEIELLARISTKKELKTLKVGKKFLRVLVRPVIYLSVAQT